MKPLQKTDSKKSQAPQDAAATLKKLESKDPGIKEMLKKAYGYAIFPSVGKANVVIGGGFGRGEVYEKGKRIGYATISQLTIGVQLGGDTFAELIIFESKEALDRFKQGKASFNANASAVLVKAGAAKTNRFEKGVVVFVYPQGGMMLELSLGGQKFKFKPAGQQGEGGGGGDKASGKSGKGQGKSAGKAESSQDDEGEQEEQDEGEGEEDGESEDEGEASQGLGQRAMELAGRAVGGARDAASKGTELVKRHPVAASVAGASLAAVLGLLIARKLRSGGQDQSSEEGESSDESQDDEQDEGAQDSSENEEDEENQDEGEGEGEAEDSADDQEEQDEDDDGGEEEESDNRGILSRLMSRGRSRA